MLQCLSSLTNYERDWRLNSVSDELSFLCGKAKPTANIAWNIQTDEILDGNFEFKMNYASPHSMAFNQF